MNDYVLITCEHGGNRIPAAYRHRFQTAAHSALLDSHRGFDAGALEMATELAAGFGAPLTASTVSRLLIDLNRSLGHPHLHSQPIRTAPLEVRREIVALHYRPYREHVENLVGKAVAAGRRVIHISSHSFTPELNGQLRKADIGLLYHPARSGEADLCARWKLVLNAWAPELKVRRNYPYAGKNDGLTTHLRRRFPLDVYVGIELEVNQKHVSKADPSWKILRGTLTESLRAALGMDRLSPPPESHLAECTPLPRDAI